MTAAAPAGAVKSVSESASPSPAGILRRLLPRAAARAGAALVVLWAVATVTFVAVRSVPGDPVEAILGGPGSNATAEAVAAARAQYGLDLPLWQQYLLSLGRLAVLDLGESYRLHRSVWAVIGELLPATLALTLAAILLAWVIALALTWWSYRGGRAGRLVADLLGIVAAALPHFWLGAVLIAVLATGLGLPVAISAPGLAGLWLPSVVLAVPLAGYLAQVMREGLEDAQESPYALAARARGGSPWHVFRIHLLRRAALPAVSITGWAFGSLVSGAVVVEQLFSRPGLGRALVDAVVARDVPMVTGVLLIVALAYVVVTFVTDLVEAMLVPAERA